MVIYEYDDREEMRLCDQHKEKVTHDIKFSGRTCLSKLTKVNNDNVK
jgi:hypothetical protein